MELLVKRGDAWVQFGSRRGALHNTASKDVHIYENTTRTGKVHVIRVLSLSRLLSFCFYLSTNQVRINLCTKMNLNHTPFLKLYCILSNISNTNMNLYSRFALAAMALVVRSPLVMLG